MRSFSAIRFIACCSALVLAGVPLPSMLAQSPPLSSDSDLAAISQRGRALAEYDSAVWHASDLVQTANPKNIEGQHYLARNENGRWTVVFGALNSEKTAFVISYQANQLANLKQFAVTKCDPAKTDRGFYRYAARALDLALADFGHPTRPYNSAVLPATGSRASGQPDLLYVYLYPAQTKVGIFPLGGDVRYLVSADGAKILAKRQLHQTILEPAKIPKSAKAAGGYHTHTLSDFPEDTDVLHVLEQDPPLPEFIGTPHFTYEVAADGSIQPKKSKKK